MACCKGSKCNDVETFDDYFLPKPTENGSSNVNDRFVIVITALTGGIAVFLQF